jgi:HSP20 family molecular chaperone IbpA
MNLHLLISSTIIMSIARVFNEMRPLFRMLEEPLTHNRSRLRGPLARRSWLEDPFEDPFFRGVGAWSNSIRPSIDLKEDDASFIVETDLPGVKKENLEVKIGDSGQSITIEGRVTTRSQSQEATAESSTSTPASTAESSSKGENPCQLALEKHQSDGFSTEVANTDAENSVVSHTSERPFSTSSVFSRTIWLPQRVDESKVTAKLEDGVLTVRIPKSEDKESIRINVE